MSNIFSPYSSNSEKSCRKALVKLGNCWVGREKNLLGSVYWSSLVLWTKTIPTKTKTIIANGYDCFADSMALTITSIATKTSCLCYTSSLLNSLTTLTIHVWLHCLWLNVSKFQLGSVVFASVFMKINTTLNNCWSQFDLSEKHFIWWEEYSINVTIACVSRYVRIVGNANKQADQQQ